MGDSPTGWGALTTDRRRQLRLRLKLTQARFADLLGVTQTTVYRWETGAAEPVGLQRDMYWMLNELEISKAIPHPILDAFHRRGRTHGVGALYRIYLEQP